ncbi:Hsp20/alpha crystallin family protein [Persicobacter sp. CCB-QB2]|uniref:Hsp20/alpha crystallin family protein n=1 Tax=Persicobacter sp. CCB-QB2 TaxID=1561025 RepID=UPI0006A9C0E3|nr:Hsp20/alpha crystallin family protein [Persicobacter sp. CCB-QB2]
MEVVMMTNGKISSLHADLLNHLFSEEQKTNDEGYSSKFPPMNVEEDEDSFKVYLATPGLSKDDLRISLKGDLLVISSEKKEHKEREKKSQFIHREFGIHPFERSLNLPREVDKEQTTASYERGILMIYLPKREDAKARSIKIIGIA